MLPNLSSEMIALKGTLGWRYTNSFKLHHRNIVLNWDQQHLVLFQGMVLVIEDEHGEVGMGVKGTA